ncbi:MAG TPA: polysaccharide biosynthesis/export family protein [Candidatus Binatia bacterium]|nr:polysaccharide biosynthesis/export family protein [Candidatus Binatia bacterium]
MRDAIAVLTAAAAALLLASSAHGQEAPASQATSVVYSETTPEYRFYPGDEIEITVFSAPELTRVVTVGPDGRVALPLIGGVRAADLNASELHDRLVSAYASHLRMPELTVTPRSYGSRQVFVGGEVARPGIYEMPAQIDAFQAVALAGGFLPSARRGDVLVLSRASGETHVSEVDLSPRAMRQGFPDAQPLQRYDVVYVPRSAISQVNLFMQQYVRDALPVQFSFYYDLRGDRNN